MEFSVNKKVKTELDPVFNFQSSNPAPIAISSSDSGSNCSSDSSDASFTFNSAIYSDSMGNGVQDKDNKRNSTVDTSGLPIKKQKLEDSPFESPSPLPPQDRVIYRGTTPIMVATPLSSVPPDTSAENGPVEPVLRPCKQFWKAGEYEVQNPKSDDSALGSDGLMDHIRVHPKFLHSNATSHKWALGAFAELLDNALDEVCYGATYVCIDVLENPKDNSKMLLVEDNGGGMSPDKMRACMSLGYSEKSKMANTIGQYGNGFKTSTMRLGEDVIVFTKTRGDDKNRPTKSIGLLSSSFLMGTGKQDIVVPMIDFEEGQKGWTKLVRSTRDGWTKNLEIITKWSPYHSFDELLNQFDFIQEQGTRVVIYNLWGDDEGKLELDFETDKQDIQVRGIKRDEKELEKSKSYTHCKHYLTYRHSLRSYAAILYLRFPPNFRLILRGNDVKHHDIVKEDLMNTEKINYKPKDSDTTTMVNIGFVKDAQYHVDVQGFNVYHKNRLIVPYWRVWTTAGSGGRGIIGVLEADFVKPAHDKQGFERTTALDRLKDRLREYQSNFWSKKRHLIGYAGGYQNQNRNNVSEQGTPSSNGNSVSNPGLREKSFSPSQNLNNVRNFTTPSPLNQNGHGFFRGNSIVKFEKISDSSNSKANGDEEASTKLKEENQNLRERLTQMASDLESEKERSKSLEKKLKESEEAKIVLENDLVELLQMIEEERKQLQDSQLQMIEERKRHQDQSQQGR